MYVTQGFNNIYNLSYHSVQYGSSLPYKHLTNIIKGLYMYRYFYYVWKFNRFKNSK